MCFPVTVLGLAITILNWFLYRMKDTDIFHSSACGYLILFNTICRWCFSMVTIFNIFIQSPLSVVLWVHYWGLCSVPFGLCASIMVLLWLPHYNTSSIALFQKFCLLSFCTIICCMFPFPISLFVRLNILTSTVTTHAHTWFCVFILNLGATD